MAANRSAESCSFDAKNWFQIFTFSKLIDKRTWNLKNYSPWKRNTSNCENLNDFSKELIQIQNKRGKNVSHSIAKFSGRMEKWTFRPLWELVGAWICLLFPVDCSWEEYWGSRREAKGLKWKLFFDQFFFVHFLSFAPKNKIENPQKSETWGSRFCYQMNPERVW